MDKTKIITGLVIIAAIAVLTSGVFFLNSKPRTSNLESRTSYKNGAYTEDGHYQSPGGPESITVKVILQNGKIVDSEVTSRAELPNSRIFQGKFIGGYKEFVTGKNIDEVNLTHVSGSSLTSKGFNDAIEKIKADAKV